MKLTGDQLLVNYILIVCRVRANVGRPSADIMVECFRRLWDERPVRVLEFTAHVANVLVGRVSLSEWHALKVMPV